MSTADRTDRRKAAVAAGVVVLHAVAIGYLLMSRLPLPPQVERSVVLESYQLPAPPRPDEKKAPGSAEPEGEAAPVNRYSKPKPVVAPKPVVIVNVPPPVVAPPVASTDAAISAGAAPAPGPGTGAGGEGSGLGSGRGGSGAGGGGSRPRWISGRIRDSDYPRAASRLKAGGMVVAHFDVGTDGRVSHCRVVASSGNADLDRATCELIEKRFRYRPATDVQGNPVVDVAGWRQDWWLEPRR